MSVERSNLANGLTVISHAMAEVETVSLGIWIGAGSRSEAQGEHGVAHFLEHMAFKGTARRSARDIAEEIEAVGGELNAATGVDSTAYYARVLRKDFALALDILSDIILSPRFDRAELSRERDVILQEIAAAMDSPEDIVFDLVQERGLPRPAGRDGRSSAPANSVERVQARPSRRPISPTHYQAPNMVLAAAGAVDHAALACRGRAPARRVRRQSSPRPSPRLRYYAAASARDESPSSRPIWCSPSRAPPYRHADYFTAQDLRRRARRRHVLALVPGGARAARALLRDLRFRLRTFRQRHVRDLRRLRTRPRRMSCSR